MNIPKISALYESSLASALSAAGTSFSLVSATDRDGNALSGRYGFIIDEGSADEEFVIGTVSGTTVTIEYRGIDADAPNTEVSANKKAHRRGASVKITDYPIIGILRNVLNGDEALPNPIKYASGVAPVTADDLVDKGYVDALLGGGTLSYDRISIAGTAGETIASGNLVYLKVSDGRWYLCDADTSATVDNVILGIAQGAGTTGNAITNGVLIKGLATNLTGLTANTKYYASNTAGAISSSAGTIEVSIGFALSTTSLLLDSRYDQQITEDQQDALAGTSGTAPSNSNKFVDNADTSTTSAASKIPRLDSAGKLDPAMIKTSKKLNISTSSTSLSASTTETTLFSTTIAGGTLGTNNAVKIEVFLGAISLDTGATLQLRLKYGATTIVDKTISPGGGSSGAVDISRMTIIGYLVANGATNAQKGALMFVGGDGTAEDDASANTNGEKVVGGSNATATEDSTADKTLSLTVQYSTTSGNNALTAEFCLITLIA
jgi:hypothetical protein